MPCVLLMSSLETAPYTSLASSFDEKYPLVKIRAIYSFNISPFIAQCISSYSAKILTLTISFLPSKKSSYFPFPNTSISFINTQRNV